MPRTIHKTEQPVVLEGFQAVMRPGKHGYCLVAIVDKEMIDILETEREDLLPLAQRKLKNPRRSVLKPEPWEEVAENKFKLKFSWKEENRPPVVDTEGTPVTDPDTRLYSGSQVKLAFYQSYYNLQDAITYGTSLKLVGVQVVSLNSGVGVDTGSMAPEDVAALFGKTEGFIADDPVVTVIPEDMSDDF